MQKSYIPYEKLRLIDGSIHLRLSDKTQFLCALHNILIKNRKKTVFYLEV